MLFGYGSSAVRCGSVAVRLRFCCGRPIKPANNRKKKSAVNIRCLRVISEYEALQDLKRLILQSVWKSLISMVIMWMNTLLSIILSNICQNLLKYLERISKQRLFSENVHSGLRTLVARREDLYKSFMHKLRSNNINVNNNPVAQLINTLCQGPEHNYQLRTHPNDPPFTRTDRFKNFITINYFWNVNICILIYLCIYLCN